MVIFDSKYLVNTQKMIIFVLSNKKTEVMKYTEKEKELIEALRNYRKAYPNGKRELEYYIMELVNDLMEHE